MKDYVPTKSCAFCNGTGTQIDHQLIGAMLRDLREDKQNQSRARGEIGKYSLDWMAQRLGLSAMYISDLERGNRHWTIDKIESFRKELE